MIKTLNVLAFTVTCLLAGALYIIKNDVEHSQDRLTRLQVEVFETRKAILLLEKEQAYLESPARLARLAQAQLGMVPMTNLSAHRSAEVLSSLTEDVVAELTPVALIEPLENSR
ncbi:MAG: hypothetical protein COA60_009035 [Robiginitomaculum sp.]|nr:hypothetical protein [Robiginitomaculum sp.]